MMFGLAADGAADQRQDQNYGGHGDTQRNPIGTMAWRDIWTPSRVHVFQSRQSHNARYGFRVSKTKGPRWNKPSVTLCVPVVRSPQLVAEDFFLLCFDGRLGMAVSVRAVSI